MFDFHHNKGFDLKSFVQTPFFSRSVLSESAPGQKRLQKVPFDSQLSEFLSYDLSDLTKVVRVDVTHLSVTFSVNKVKVSFRCSAVKVRFLRFWGGNDCKPKVNVRQLSEFLSYDLENPETICILQNHVA